MNFWYRATTEGLHIRPVGQVLAHGAQQKGSAIKTICMRGLPARASSNLRKRPAASSTALMITSESEKTSRSLGAGTPEMYAATCACFIKLPPSHGPHVKLVQTLATSMPLSGCTSGLMDRVYDDSAEGRVSQTRKCARKRVMCPHNGQVHTSPFNYWEASPEKKKAK